MPAKQNGAEATRQSQMANAANEVATQLARTAAGELVKGQQPLREVARTVVGEAFVELDKRGPALVEDAGIMTWRYALLGYVTWHVGKRVIKRKANRAIRRSNGDGAGANGNAKPLQRAKATRGNEDERSSDG